jgi:predicted DNA-binding protein
MQQSATRKLGLNVPAEMAEKLKSLSDRTMIPQSRLLRQALDLLFAHYDSAPREPKPAKARK